MLLPEWMLKYKNHIDKEDFYPEKNPEDSLLLLHAINFSMNKDSMKFIHEYNKILDDYNTVEEYNTSVEIFNEYIDDRKLYDELIENNSAAEHKILDLKKKLEMNTLSDLEENMYNKKWEIELQSACNICHKLNYYDYSNNDEDLYIEIEKIERKMVNIKKKIKKERWSKKRNN